MPMNKSQIMRCFHFVSQGCRQQGCSRQGYMDAFTPCLERQSGSNLGMVHSHVNKQPIQPLWNEVEYGNCIILERSAGHGMIVQAIGFISTLVDYWPPAYSTFTTSMWLKNISLTPSLRRVFFE